MVQTEARLARGHVRRVQRGATGFSQRRALVASADGVWAICVPAPGEFGAWREEGIGCEEERVDRKVTRVDEDEVGGEICKNEVERMRG